MSASLTPPIISPLQATDPLDTQQFRAALGLFATGVTIVTARAEDGSLVGLTANSFNSVSLSPPLVLWSLAQRAGSMPVFSRGSHYAIHILGADQKALAQRFATRDIDRFDGVRWHEGLAGVPLLDGCVAVFECANRSRYEEGDHVIFVGEVERCHRVEQGQPLIFHGGRYFTELPI
ncbi:flavin reductase family protein [Pelomonas sp. CA6]|uniref:flavin reductase family protein n=1 Tax=Pelomonas sp. CA6 TaxID=2907999 RepID=UPI001F4C047F|nr:flavin reductase family protein [Pelomonas sp. CA6]MCH7345496.1 flavin reductase family protein [Pelomonas sp. CA6]